MSNKKHIKSAVCIIMALAMVVCAFVGVAAFEKDLADTGATGTVYYQNTTNWGTVYCYMWNGGGEQKNAEWPGVQMTQDSGNVWKYTANGDYQNVIFNNGSGGTGNQTADLQFPGGGQIYNGSGWTQYAEPDQPSTDDPNPNPNPNPDPDPNPNPNPNPGSKYVYCENQASWGSVYCYMWKDGAGENAAWPGKPMENIGENIWRYEVTGSWDKIIFNGGSGGPQTDDMSFSGGDKIFNNSNGSWKDYDTSPITVKSYTTSPADAVYKNMEVTVSANATSTGGKVYYKYSVTSGSSTTVLKDFSTATSVKWTPTAAGTYTITWEFKDAANNENKRTATVTVKDDSSVADPIIKKVTPGTTQVKNNTNMNIAVTAGGGKVGTNLLFYKFTIQDANGKILNVPYYSKTATCTYKPTSLGKFTVTVSVQNSENAFVERTYTFESVKEVTEPVDPDVPTPTGVLGDADNDGQLSVMDATLIQRWAALLVPDSQINLSLSDYDKDGKVSVMDATTIQQKLAGLI